MVKNIVEILTNFQLITAHFGEDTLDQVANVNFMVFLTNAYCLLRKIKKYWLGECQSKSTKETITSWLGTGEKLTITVCSIVL